MDMSSHCAMTSPIFPALSSEKTPSSQSLRSSTICDGFVSRLKLGFENSFLYGSSKQVVFRGVGACHGRVAPRTNASGFSASVISRALNLYEASFARTQTHFPLSTKYACLEDSDLLAP